MENKEQLGCLALLFGVKRRSTDPGSGMNPKMGEGEIHSGPGGYEGMGYSGGYAADYFNDQDAESGER